MEDSHEVGSRIDRIDVEEDLFFAEAPVQVIGQATGIARRIISPVADEDTWWHRGLVRPQTESCTRRSSKVKGQMAFDPLT
jgi:hypothetical protein